jgi:peptidoglycan/LPS O-acetylase OafA/YrhL
MAGASAPVGIRPTTSYLPELESLRGIAIVFVYVFHLDRFVVSVFPPLDTAVAVTPWLALIRAGNTGVSLFFVLSGFLLSRPVFADAARGPRAAAHFYLRRALRILPLYYAAVFAATILRARQLADLWDGVPYLFFLNGVFGLATPLNPYSWVWWSLATEVQFYALLPILPLLLRVRYGRSIGIALALSYAAAYVAYLCRYVTMSTIGGELQLASSLFGRAPQFLAGMITAWVYERFGARMRASLAARRWVRAGAADGALLALVGALALLLQWVLASGSARLETPPYQCWHAVEGSCWAAILLLVVIAPLRSKRLFCNAVLARLGVLSYSIYMWHVPIVFLSLNALRHRRIRGLVGWHPHSVAVAAGLSATCLAVAALTHWGIERPFLIRKARLD